MNESAYPGAYERGAGRTEVLNQLEFGREYPAVTFFYAVLGLGRGVV